MNWMSVTAGSTMAKVVSELYNSTSAVGKQSSIPVLLSYEVPLASVAFNSSVAFPFAPG